MGASHSVVIENVTRVERHRDRVILYGAREFASMKRDEIHAAKSTYNYKDHKYETTIKLTNGSKIRCYSPYTAGELLGTVGEGTVVTLTDGCVTVSS